MSEQGKFQAGPEEAAAFFQALGMSAMNGVLSLVTIMAKRKLLSTGEVELIHTQMSGPLQAPHNAGNRGVQDVQQNVDAAFAKIRRIAGKKPPAP